MNMHFHREVRSCNQRGLAAFTMIEIALALAVIGFALVAIIGVLPAGMSVQKDNRESTLVNFDANFLMDAITSGSIGTDELTNHVIVISNYYTFFNSNVNGTFTPGASHWIAYKTNGTLSDKPLSTATSVLTNGANIITLLSTPKYILAIGGFYSNYITADFRGISGSLADQGTSQTAQDFAFAYRVFPEIIPYGSLLMPWTNGPDFGPAADNFQTNYTQVRLRFRWPVLPNGQVGNSRLTFRTAASGVLAMSPSMVGGVISNAVIQPGTYVWTP